MGSTGASRAPDGHILRYFCCFKAIRRVRPYTLHTLGRVPKVLNLYGGAPGGAGKRVFLAEKHTRCARNPSRAPPERRVGDFLELFGPAPRPPRAPPGVSKSTFIFYMFNICL